MTEAFSSEQQRYLEGFTSGLLIARRQHESSSLPAPGGGSNGTESAEGNPDGPARAAQARLLASGGRLTAEEQAKRERHPLDRWNELVQRARAGRFPAGIEVFLTKYYGLFHVAPAEDAFMCRLRLPNGLLTASQVEGIARLTEEYALGHADITTRANLQIRGIGASAGVDVVMRLQELGIITRGAGADNVRNVTGSATAGIDPEELIDTRPYARAMHQAVLNSRALYNLPRKFNIAFEGGGAIATLEETNDIAFTAVRVPEEPALPDGIGFRIAFGGITGHGDLATQSPCVCAPDQAIEVATAALEVFIAEGDRGDRKRARLKYLLDRWGHERFIAAVEERLGRPLLRLAFPPAGPVAAAARLRAAHVGVHRQRQPGLCWVGILPPGGRLWADQLREIAALARRYAGDAHGEADIRLTVWQSLLIANVPEAATADLCAALAACGLPTQAGPVRAGMVACTGSRGCRFAAADTKGMAARIIEQVEARALPLDTPVNIHVTGCHHSCAQHYIGDIGLIACRIVDAATDEDGPGFDVVLGGGHGGDARIGAVWRRQVPEVEIPELVADLLTGYLQARSGPGEDFRHCILRVSGDDLLQAAARRRSEEPVA
jgi:ferredoxin-nitrite reductase